MRWQIVPTTSRVWIEGSSSLHAIRAQADGLEGFVDVDLAEGRFRPESEVLGHVEIEVHRLASGNPIVDRETRRRIDAKRHPSITGDIRRGVVAGPMELAIEGEIGFRGETVLVEGSLALVAASPDEIVLEGRSIFDVRWWELRVPTLGLLRVHPDIEVTVQLTLVPAR